MTYSINDIAKHLEAKETFFHNASATISDLLTDSRSLTYPDATLFFALRTKNNDGHNYVPDLYSRGVRNFVVDHCDALFNEFADANFVVVDNTLQALHKLAAYHRSQFNIPIIGITGSNGKTTVKEWLYQLLGNEYKIARSPRSYNSQIGVALSLWEISGNTSLAIIEAGISMRGEMLQLEQIIKPTIGVFTNIGAAHNENFSSIEQKASEKAILLRGCNSVVYQACNEVVENLTSSNKYSWSASCDAATVCITEVSFTNQSSCIKYRYDGHESEFTVPFVATEEAQENIFTCLTTMICLGLSPDFIAKRFARLAPTSTRTNVFQGVNDCVIIADSYTSDYNSLAPALDFMARRATKDAKLTAILSDVTHESFSSETLYSNIANLLQRKNVHRLIAIGKEFGKYKHLFATNTTFCDSTADFLNEMTISDFEKEHILIKGAPEFHFDKIADLFDAKQHQTVLEVNLDALASNYNIFRSMVKPTTKIVGMLKASGYGAGSYELAKTLQDRGMAYVAVAVCDEGVDLRAAGITMPIMVLNPSVTNYKTMFEHHLEPEVFSLDQCRLLIHEAQKYGVKNYPVHIKLDSGMHRLGFLKEHIAELVGILRNQDQLLPASVFSHLAVADEPEKDDYTLSQFKYFEECCDELQASFSYHISRHILNSTGIVRFPEHQYDMVRLGIGLYGIKTTDDGSEDDLQPVSSLHSVIISIKEWDENATIGYGRRGVLNRKSRIATIPIGYADGYDRHFGNGNAHMWVNGVLCPTVGNICMDVCMIDVTDAPCKVGDNVEIFGKHIPVEHLAQARGTISYEVLTSISSRIKRIYYSE